MNHLLTTEPSYRPAPDAVRPPRRGFTLIELMIVIAILLAVTVASIPVLGQNSGHRLLRESARTVSEMLNSARNRAIASGRPAGVWFDPLPDPTNTVVGKAAASQTLYFCEQPAPYCGDTPTASVKVTANQLGDGSTSQFTPVAKIHFIPDIEPTLKQLGIVENVTNGKLQGGPYYIRIGGSGPYYKLENQTNTPRFFNGTGVNKVATISLPNVAPTTAATALTQGTVVQLPPIGRNLTDDTIPGLPYQIIRGAVKSADAPVQLPASACVDLSQSGMTQLGTNGVVETVFTLPWPLASNVWPVNSATNGTAPAPVGLPLTPLIVWFGPNGSLQRVYWSVTSTTAGTTSTTYYSTRPTSFLHFLIGRRELVMPYGDPTILAASTAVTSLIDGNLGRPTPTNRKLPEAAPGEPGPSATWWVTVGATGQVTVAENVDPTNDITAAIANNQRNNTLFQLGVARSKARAQQAAGGRQ